MGSKSFTVAGKNDDKAPYPIATVVMAMAGATSTHNVPPRSFSLIRNCFRSISRGGSGWETTGSGVGLRMRIASPAAIKATKAPAINTTELPTCSDSHSPADSPTIWAAPVNNPMIPDAFPRVPGGAMCATRANCATQREPNPMPRTAATSNNDAVSMLTRYHRVGTPSRNAAANMTRR